MHAKQTIPIRRGIFDKTMRSSQVPTTITTQLKLKSTTITVYWLSVESEQKR